MVTQIIRHILTSAYLQFDLSSTHLINLTVFLYFINYKVTDRAEKPSYMSGSMIPGDTNYKNHFDTRLSTV